MDILIIASALAIATLVVPLAVIVIGIHRQERAGLATRHAGACAAIACKMLALHTTPSSSANRSHAVPAAAPMPHRKPSTAQADRDPAPARPALATGSRP
jgi:hypothetical protein